ncbi:MAG TPA: hypothetical protein VI336_04190 [Candidatus Saccharimonadales bacterium]|nr:hypothetical protein [Candidatus Saccharimonadales bacterium]
MEQEPSQEAESNSREIADLVKEFGEEFGFDEETCEEIAAMPFEDAFETTYGYLTQAGLDPDEVLAPFIEEPEIIGGPH